MGGHVMIYLNGAVSWNAGYAKLVPDSTCEAEMARASKATKDCVFGRQLLSNNGRAVSGPTPILGDNRAVFLSVEQTGASSRTRHFERATLLIKRAVMLLISKPFLVATSHMIADIFTKATDKGTYIRARNEMMNAGWELRASVDSAMGCYSGSIYRMLNKLSKML